MNSPANLRYTRTHEWVQTIDDNTVRIGLTEERGIVVVRVEDTGCGISPENLRRLFKPFFTTKDVGQGTGLGLAFVSLLLAEMGSRISVTSTLGRGATFIMEFGAGAS